MRPFLTAGGHSPEQVDAMHAAWFKAVTLHATAWIHLSLPDRF